MIFMFECVLRNENHHKHPRNPYQKNKKGKKRKKRDCSKLTAAFNDPQGLLKSWDVKFSQVGTGHKNR